MDSDRDKKSILSATAVPQINIGVVFILLTCLATITGTSAMPCPVECQCSVHDITIVVDCSEQGLSVLPEFDPTMEINYLDLSNNQLTDFPASLSAFPMLETLILSNNQISNIPANSLDGFSSLRILNLDKNQIANWQDIHPNELLIKTKVTALHLSGNLLTSFSSSDENLILFSSTLRLLDISNCRITKVNGAAVLIGLTDLQILDLSENPLRYVANLFSPSLLILKLANCQLSGLPGDFLSGLSQLNSLDLSGNHRISLFRSVDEYVHSDSLTKIDLSFCNMDNVELQGFPQLKIAILRNNLIKDIGRDTFAHNEHLQMLQLANNDIGQIHPQTFALLRQLRELDLSFNVIMKLDRDTFKQNEKLTSINLSRNYIGRFSRLVSPSLAHLNMSSCEIMSIDGDALIGLPNLINLDLSQNLIAAIPDSLVSDTLQLLDLRMCRISSMRNVTLMNLPELSRLRLSGNRFTTPFRREFFEHNPYLNELWLGDNPWRCDCQNDDFFKFFVFITEEPAKLYDRDHLRCGSPEEHYGRLWESYCYSYWVQSTRPLGTAEKVWTIVLILILLLTAGSCIVMTVRKCINGRELTRREREREAFLEEQRDVIRQNRMAMDQQAQLNAPDPRETRPPCYEDALLLPRLDGSFASLNELGQKKETKKGVRSINREVTTDPHQQQPIQDPQAQLIDEAPAISPRNRCRSEEVLSMRDIVTNRRSGKYRVPTTTEGDFENHHYANISRNARRSNSKSRLPTSPPPTRIPTPPPELPPPPPIPGKPTGSWQSNSDLHYHSTEILNHLPGEKALPAVIPLSPVLSQSSAEYDDLEDFNITRESPYSRRKSRNLSTFKTPSTSRDALPEPDEILVIEDHYPRMPTPKPKRLENISSSSSETGSSGDGGFVAISTSDLVTYATVEQEEEERQIKLERGEKPEQTAVEVQVHRQPRESSL